jgi:hypothetical protein
MKDMGKKTQFKDDFDGYINSVDQEKNMCD